MPDKPLRVAAYAAGASLAAVTLVYVFGPTFFLDDDAAQSTKSSRKRGIVGLANPANDCFINSVLQTLAGVPELRIYLIRELHLRRMEGRGVYDVLESEEDQEEAVRKAKEQAGEEDEVAPFKRQGEKIPEWKQRGLQQGLVTSGLKEMLDALNERPIYKKTLSAQGFVGALEQAFRTRINRSQQDAQEFLQLVVERLAEEFYAGMKARKRARRRTKAGLIRKESGETEERDTGKGEASSEKMQDQDEDREEKHPSFPFEGKIESQIECTHCRFKPRPSASSFVTLTLHVPQGGNSTSLSTCFDGMLKVEHIDDFKCAKCRMAHALETKMTALAKLSSKSTSESDDTLVEAKKEVEVLKNCMEEDPETPPKDISLPPITEAPKRKIARHSRIATFPRVLAIHLSRSMWDNTTSSAKNMSKVSFPETLPLGGLLEQVSYRLLGVVTHKGGHNSGHYESFRRQMLREPYLAPVSMGESGLYSNLGTPRGSTLPSPALKARTSKDVISNGLSSVDENGTSTESGSPDAVSTLSPIGPSESTSSITSAGKSSRSGTLATEDTRASSPSSVSAAGTETGKKTDLRRKSSMTRVAERFKGDSQRKKVKKNSSRWWRISDDKIKECTTKDVLKQEREVYMLFYELMEPGEVA
ncbi:Ubiquitin carboxyl-terminal hydrolase-like protein 6 [Elsinoe fawcettii]|nr:Ubiquitin carboxyl-terminal hydrolase-like protein 6 [Elsinoe fawcettii]